VLTALVILIVLEGLHVGVSLCVLRVLQQKGGTRLSGPHGPVR
jgi:hypothetical protein